MTAPATKTIPLEDALGIFSLSKNLPLLAKLGEEFVANAPQNVTPFESKLLMRLLDYLLLQKLRAITSSSLQEYLLALLLMNHMENN